MDKNEKFPYEIDNGAVVDFVDGRFLLAIKDDFWSDEEIALCRRPLDLHYCYTNDLAIFVLEGGPIDSGDFYFNIQECDEAESLLNSDSIKAEVMFVNGANDICFKRQAEFSAKDSEEIKSTLKKQSETEFFEGEYDVNVEGIQSAYQPYDLLKFARASLKI